MSSTHEKIDAATIRETPHVFIKRADGFRYCVCGASENDSIHRPVTTTDKLDAAPTSEEELIQAMLDDPIGVALAMFDVERMAARMEIETEERAEAGKEIK